MVCMSRTGHHWSVQFISFRRDDTLKGWRDPPPTAIVSFIFWPKSHKCLNTFNDAWNFTRNHCVEQISDCRDFDIATFVQHFIRSFTHKFIHKSVNERQRDRVCVCVRERKCLNEWNFHEIAESCPVSNATLSFNMTEYYTVFYLEHNVYIYTHPYHFTLCNKFIRNGIKSVVSSTFQLGSEHFP